MSELRQRLKDAEQRARRVDELETENTQLRNDLAFATCGVEMNDAQRKAIGLLVDEATPDTIRAAYHDLGFSGISAAEADALSRRAEAMNGAPPAPPDLGQQIASASTPEEVVQLLVSAEPGA